MQGAAIKSDQPTPSGATETAPIRVSCQWCDKFLFKTYFAQTKIEIKCHKCRKDMLVKIDESGLSFGLL